MLMIKIWRWCAMKQLLSMLLGAGLVHFVFLCIINTWHCMMIRQERKGGEGGEEDLEIMTRWRVCDTFVACLWPLLSGVM